MDSLRLGDVKNDSSKVQLERVSSIYYEHADLDAFGKFATDFGFVEASRSESQIVFRGYGKDPFCYVAQKAKDGSPSFGGGAWVAQSQEDFDKAAAMKDAEVTDLSQYPGGGRKVTLRSPCRFSMHIIYGQEERTAPETAASAVVESLGPLNGSIEKRRFGKFQRFHHGPAMIHKLGHYGCIVAKWNEEIEWYTTNFNLVPSDILTLPRNPDVDVIAFMHLDLGERFSDHHSFFLARAQPGESDRIHHSSFEVEDFDTQLLGHDWLAKKGYRSYWGVGRHILGSQIFDYWKDPSDYIIEHYADGDLVNTHTPTKRDRAGPLSVWGPEMPADMTENAVKGTAS